MVISPTDPVAAAHDEERDALTIAPAQADDCSCLSALAFAAKAHWGYPVQWLEAWRQELTLTPDQLSDWWVYLARSEHDALGFYALGVAGSIGSIEHFWVAPRYHGHGVGRALFRHLIRQALTLHLALVEIESDPNAETFYRRMGAQPAGCVCRPVLGEHRVLPVLHLPLVEPSPQHHSAGPH